MQLIHARELINNSVQLQSDFKVSEAEEPKNPRRGKIPSEVAVQSRQDGSVRTHPCHRAWRFAYESQDAHDRRTDSCHLSSDLQMCTATHK